MITAGNRSLLIIIAILLAIALTLALLWQFSKADQTNDSQPESASTEQMVANQNAADLENKLIIEDLRLGDGQSVEEDDLVLVHYRGSLTDGTEFDNSYQTDSPLRVQLGQQKVIEGWDQGLPGARVGGIRKLTIPPELAYQDLEQPDIPANSTLIFEIEVIRIL